MSRRQMSHSRTPYHTKEKLGTRSQTVNYKQYCTPLISSLLSRLLDGGQVYLFTWARFLPFFYQLIINIWF